VAPEWSSHCRPAGTLNEATGAHNIHRTHLGIDRFRARAQSLAAASHQLKQGHGLFLVPNAKTLRASAITQMVRGSQKAFAASDSSPQFAFKCANPRKQISPFAERRKSKFLPIDQGPKDHLAIVLAREDDSLDGPHYIPHSFPEEPGWGVASVTYNIRALLEQSAKS